MPDWKKVFGDVWWDWIIRLLIILSLMFGAWSVMLVKDIAACQAQFNEITNQRTRILTEATEQEREAERRADDAQAALFTSAILSTPTSERTPEQRAELVRLFTEYQQSLTHQIQERNEADVARKQHPVPPPPSKLCN